MKKYIYIIVILICFVKCNAPKSTCNIDKINIYYEPDIDPWGDTFFFRYTTSDFLTEYKLREISITNRDSLSFVAKRIKNISESDAEMQDIDSYYPEIVLLIHSNKDIDTIAMSVYPDYYMQYNNYKFCDSILGHFVINIIRERDSVWNKLADVYFYDGKYNTVPKSFWNKK